MVVDALNRSMSVAEMGARSGRRRSRGDRPKPNSPENRPQGLDKMRFAPGISATAKLWAAAMLCGKVRTEFSHRRRTIARKFRCKALI
jgi:hypothetical protein